MTMATRWSGHDAGRKAVCAALLTVAALLIGCGESDGSRAQAGAGAGDDSPGGNPSQTIPTSMLADGGTTRLPPAQEFQLAELGFDYGSEDAPIKVVEFSDYGCGYCRRFHAETFPALMTDYIETGRVQWKYVTYVSGMFANGMVAAFAAECAGEQDLFRPMSRLLYERQSDWKSMGEPYPVFEEIAVEVGAGAEEFQACIAEQRPRGRVRSGILTGSRLGVRGTPSFLVNGVPIVGAQPHAYWDGLFTAIESETGGGASQGGPAGGGPAGDLGGTGPSVP